MGFGEEQHQTIQRSCPTGLGEAGWFFFPEEVKKADTESNFWSPLGITGGSKEVGQ